MVIVGSDHSGYELKNIIIEHLKNKNIQFLDVTLNNAEKDDDYPDVAKLVCENVLRDKNNFGIAICGTGIGISIAANKIKGIMAAVCTDLYMAEMARRHNDANVLCLGSRLEISNRKDDLLNVVDKFLTTDFDGERHIRRINKIKEIENNN